MDVQSHTRTHRVLQTLGRRGARERAARARGAMLEDVLGEPVSAISYPVGRPLRADAAHAAAVRDAGYELGFSNGTGVNRSRASTRSTSSASRSTSALSDAVLPDDARPPLAGVLTHATNADPRRRPASSERSRPDGGASSRARRTPQPVLTPLWLLAWWREFGDADGRALRVVAVEDGDDLVGLAAAARCRRAAHRRRDPRAAPRAPRRPARTRRTRSAPTTSAGSPRADARTTSRGPPRSAIVDGRSGDWDELRHDGDERRGSAACPKLAARPAARGVAAAGRQPSGESPYMPLADDVGRRTRAPSDRRAATS